MSNTATFTLDAVRSAPGSAHATSDSALRAPQHVAATADRARGRSEGTEATAILVHCTTLRKGETFAAADEGRLELDLPRSWGGSILANRDRQATAAHAEREATRRRASLSPSAFDTALPEEEDELGAEFRARDRMSSPLDE